MNETRELAYFLSELSYESLPAEIVEKVEDLILDQIGVQLAASVRPWSQIVYKYVRGLGGPPESTVLNYGDRLPTVNAAFANASFGHGLEADDSHLPSATHPGCVIVASALALGERELASGKAVITAVVAGYEAMCRVGYAVPRMTSQGFHATSTAGTFGAAAVGGQLLGFDPPKMTHALSIAASHSAGLMEFTQTGGSLKRMHAGIGAEGGLRAAFLAQLGLTGPPTAIEGAMGFANAFKPDKSYVLERITEGLGTNWKVMEMMYKRYCADGGIHAPLDALNEILAQHPIDPDNVEEVWVGLTLHAKRIVGTIYEPQELTDCQFSGPFSIGLRLVKGGNLVQHYTEENVWDPQIRALAKRVRMEVDDEMQQGFPARLGAKVRVTLKDGRTYEATAPTIKGTPESPITREELQEKFRRMATVALSDARARQVQEAVCQLATMEDVSRLMPLLVR